MDDKKSSLVVFDLDKTLLDADCEFTWCTLLVKQELVGIEFLDRVAHYFIEYEEGTIDYVAYESYLVNQMKGLSRQQLHKLLDAFLEELTPLVRPLVIQRMERHKAQGNTILLATSTNSMLAEPIAQSLGIENLVCTQVEMSAGVPTGNLLGPPAFGSNKVKKVKEWVSDHTVTLEGSWFYSDSYNDLPLLEMVQNPVAVTPDARLRKHALEHGWEVIDIP